jgi:hypothetical protein
MRVLLVESTPGNAEAVRAWLEESGHETATCFEPTAALAGPGGLGCRGVDHPEDCPLDRPTDLAVLVRDFDGGARSLTEMGAVCALRHRVHLVELTEPDPHDLDATMLAVVSEAHTDAPGGAYAEVVRAALAELDTLGGADVGVRVTRSPDRVHVMLDVPTAVDDRVLPMTVDRASRAVRGHDPFVKVIDVGVNRV